MNAKQTTLELESFLPYRLSILSNTVSGAIAERYAKDFEMTIPEWRIMAVLGRYPGLSAGEVAERTAMDKVAVSRAVARLIESDRVSRSVADADRRRSILELSSAGWAVYEKIVPIALGYEQELMRSLPREQRRQLDSTLDQLLTRARKMAARNH